MAAKSGMKGEDLTGDLFLKTKSEQNSLYANEKTRLLAGRGDRNDITDFNLVVNDDNPVNEQFD